MAGDLKFDTNTELSSRRTGMSLTLVANSFLRVPPSPLIRAIQVPAGADAADNLIAERVLPCSRKCRNRW